MVLRRIFTFLEANRAKSVFHILVTPRDSSRKALAFLGAPALALLLSACGGGGTEVASADTSSAAPAAEVSAASPGTPGVIEAVSTDQAIANADSNIASLELADNVLDIEVLAVGDGSVQTMRDVVIGDRPVLVWFFSPH